MRLARVGTKRPVVCPTCIQQSPQTPTTHAKPTIFLGLSQDNTAGSRERRCCICSTHNDLRRRPGCNRTDSPVLHARIILHAARARRNEGNSRHAANSVARSELRAPLKPSLSIPRSRMLDAQRADFNRNPFLALPMAGPIPWCSIGGDFLPVGPTSWILFVATGSIYRGGIPAHDSYAGDAAAELHRDHADRTDVRARR